MFSSIMDKKILSVFLDESGDVGRYEQHSPNYVVSFVFHEQENSISDIIKELDLKMDNLGYCGNTIHTGPIIRNEKEYKNEKLLIRQKIFKAIMAFFRKCPIRCHTIYIEKKHIKNRTEILEKLSKQLTSFLIENISYFLQFDEVIIYYDNGQGVINELISRVFPLFLKNVSFRKVYPSQYKLFQVADMLCTMKNIEIKMKSKTLSKSEINFFNKQERVIKKEYLKNIEFKSF